MRLWYVLLQRLRSLLMRERMDQDLEEELQFHQQQKLEQLRALEAGMRIDITLVDTVPRGVDTPADLETARQILAKT